MSLYSPPQFTEHDRAAIARLMHERPFATLVTPAEAEPMVSHLPLLLVPGCEPHGTLIGHFARANPHWQRAREAPSIAVFHGPHAYISPSWYGAPSRMVPTWNYASVHAHGTLEIVDDAVEAQGIMDALVHRFEAARTAPWTFLRDRRERDALMGAIVSFRMRIRRVDAKFKLSQNRSVDDRARVIAALRTEGHPESGETADWMQRYADPSHGRDDPRYRRDDEAEDGRIRFDKWLWAARFYKTRSLCVQAIDAGQVRVNGDRAKPARNMRVGELVSIRKSGIVCEVIVTALSDRRGNATAAAKLYAETEASMAAREEAHLLRRANDAAQPRLPGRPTKRQRRKLEDFLNEP